MQYKKKYIGISLFAFLLSSCGIPSISIFESASLKTNAGEKTVTIIHNTSNNSKKALEFKGYEIYYKLYKSTDTDKRNSDKDYITDTSRVPSPRILTSKNYLRIKTGSFQGINFIDSEDSPNVPIKGNNRGAILDFGISDTEKYKYIRGTDTNYGYQALIIFLDEKSNSKVLQRNLKDSSSTSFFYNRASDNFKKDDYDIKKMISSFNTEDNSILELVIAIIPFGINLSNVQVVYGNIVVSEGIPLEYTRTP